MSKSKTFGPVSAIKSRDSLQTEKMSEKVRERLRHPQFQMRLLVAAAVVWHLMIATTVYEIGKHQLAPNQIYQSGIGKFASDGLAYEPQCVELCSVMKNDGPIAWLTWPTQLHVRLYSLPLMVFIRWSAFNILTIEPLNLLYYLGIVALVFKLGEKVYDRTSGLVAAFIVAVWPSFLIHTTQLLRDPLLILAVLVFLWSIGEPLRREFSWRRAILLVIAATVSIVTIRIVRLPMWTLLCVFAGFAVLLLVIRFVQTRRISRTAAAFGVILITVVAITPRFQPLFHNQQELRRPRAIVPEAIQQLPVDQQIAARRAGFQFRMEEGNVGPADDGSRIDAEVRFRSIGDMVRYAPRALVIGIFAPFPNMWFGVGKQVGGGGRWISGFEMFITYLLEGLALFGLWVARRKLEAWLLCGVALLGSVALGLVVNNIGALYRLRYPFWIIMVIISAGGLVHLLRSRVFKWRAFRS
ncbi:MAG TPA: hypothetical protein VNG71_22515 [Pyrinomonadaceae bacterium]|nr:hypothetical protein [Pyrinomonadaceae bacterium]